MRGFPRPEMSLHRFSRAGYPLMSSVVGTAHTVVCIRFRRAKATRAICAVATREPRKQGRGSARPRCQANADVGCATGGCPTRDLRRHWVGTTPITDDERWPWAAHPSPRSGAPSLLVLALEARRYASILQSEADPTSARVLRYASRVPWNSTESELTAGTGSR
jgi:hypothetical protein